MAVLENRSTLVLRLMLALHALVDFLLLDHLILADVHIQVVEAQEISVQIHNQQYLEEFILVHLDLEIHPLLRDLADIQAVLDILVPDGHKVPREVHDLISVDEVALEVAEKELILLDSSTKLLLPKR